MVLKPLKSLSGFKVFPLWQGSNPIDKTPIGGQGASFPHNRETIPTSIGKTFLFLPLYTLVKAIEIFVFFLLFCFSPSFHLITLKVSFYIFLLKETCIKAIGETNISKTVSSKITIMKTVTSPKVRSHSLLMWWNITEVQISLNNIWNRIKYLTCYW